MEWSEDELVFELNLTWCIVTGVPGAERLPPPPTTPPPADVVEWRARRWVETAGEEEDIRCGVHGVDWVLSNEERCKRECLQKEKNFELIQVFNWDMFLNTFLYSSTMSSKKVLSSDDKDKSQFNPRWTFLYYCVFWLCALSCAFP